MIAAPVTSLPSSASPGLCYGCAECRFSLVLAAHARRARAGIPPRACALALGCPLGGPGLTSYRPGVIAAGPFLHCTKRRGCHADGQIGTDPGTGASGPAR